MTQQSVKPRKVQGRTETTAKKTSSAKNGGQSKQSTDRRLNAIFDALTEELLTTLENNYDTKGR